MTRQVMTPRRYHGMAPSDFYLFPKLKSHLCGRQYGSNEGVIEEVHEYLRDQVKAFFFWNRDGLSALHWREIILKSNGQIFIPW